MVRHVALHGDSAPTPDAHASLAERFERVSSVRGNVAGIMQWLDKGGEPAAGRSETGDPVR